MSKTIPFVRGFRVPTQIDIDRALGDESNYSDEFRQSFDSLPQPTSDLDWLANYRERGQTYADYLDECPLLDEKNTVTQKTIYLTLFDNDDRLSILDINQLIDYTQRFFQIQVKLLPIFSNFRWNDKKNKWTCSMKTRNNAEKDIDLVTRYDSSTGHSQIYVQSILGLLIRAIPSDAHCLVAITLHDFYSDLSDLFIAGLANGNSRVAAFSFFRYDPRLALSEELWYDWEIKKSKSKTMPRILLLRSCRLLTHEIGHLLGLGHCIYYHCLMNGSGHLEEDFSQPLFECPIDLRKLSTLVGFDIIHRYEDLLDCCRKNQFKDEIQLLEKRLTILKQKKSTTKKNKTTTDERKSNTKRLRKN